MSLPARTVAAVVGETVGQLGATRVFTLLGSGNYLVTVALRGSGVPVVSLRHETAVVTAADAYARVTGEVGIATVHQGPGLTNALTGLAEAVKSRTPLLLLAADTAGAAVRSNFRIDQAGVVAAVGAGVERVHGPGSAVVDTARAYRRAWTERRPVVLMLPLDVQAGPAQEVALPPEPGPGRQPVRPAERAVGALDALLSAAARPVLLAGRGAVLAGATSLLEQLADATGSLLATSAVAAGAFGGHPFDLGISGGFASPVAADLLASADLVVAFGASLTMWTTRHGRLLGAGATVVQVDSDPDALGANARLDLAVLGDCTQTARDLLAALGPARRSAWRSPELADRIAAGRWSVTPYDDRSDATSIDPRTLTRVLDAVLPAERTLVVDSGHFMGWPPMYLAVPRDHGFVFTQGFQSVGLGLATAVGAALARPDRLTVCCLGDGGLLMTAGELESVARLGLPVLAVVYDDGAYGAEVHHFGPAGHPVDLVRFPQSDLAGMARAAGWSALTVRAVADLEGLQGWLERRAGPLLLDAKVVPTVVAEWLEEAFRGH